jgi:hypothetical protein
MRQQTKVISIVARYLLGDRRGSSARASRTAPSMMAWSSSGSAAALRDLISCTVRLKTRPADGNLDEFRELAFFHAPDAEIGAQGKVDFLGDFARRLSSQPSGC